MKKSRLLALLAGLLASAFLATSTGVAQELIYSFSEQDAINRATSEGKLILTDIGRDTCTDCAAMETRFESATLRQRLLGAYIMWKTNFDGSTVVGRYTTPGTTVELPVCAFVDPNKMSTEMITLLGLIDTGTLLDKLVTRAFLCLPLSVTNVPVAPLVGSTYLVKGIARTNAAITKAITNSPIQAVMYRLNGTGEFQTATPLVGSWKNWSANVTLTQHTNTFESYVQYAAGRSWTNKVILATLNPDASKQTQTISFASLPAKTYGNPTFTLTASASSSLPVTYSNSNPSVATISGSTVTIVGAGTTTITASQGGNESFFPAASVAQVLTVNKAAQTITFGSLPPKSLGDPAFALTATTSSGLSVSYSSSDTNVAKVAGSTVTIVGVGSTTITASQSGNANYLAAANVSQDLVVASQFSIVGNPTSQVAGAGGSATFNITTSGNPSLTYQWQMLQGGTWVNLTGATTPSYTVPSVTPATAGNYRCSVSDGTGTKTSAEAGLWLMPAPHKLYFGVNVFGPTGQAFHLEYTTNLNNPAPTWTRLTNAVGLSRSGQVVVDEETANAPMRVYRLVVP